jgi:hypothetical protein
MRSWQSDDNRYLQPLLTPPFMSRASAIISHSTKLHPLLERAPQIDYRTTPHPFYKKKSTLAR